MYMQKSSKRCCLTVGHEYTPMSEWCKGNITLGDPNGYGIA